jgi:4,5-dihydroxyphthalate decarboxylase
MADVPLSIALEHYDRHVPWVEGTVRPKGIEPTVLIVGQDGAGGRRHERMLLHREFDVCELSLGSYIMAKARGAALTAIPVFPRRLFSQSQMYVNTQSGIRGPQDLIGKRVALRSFQTTLSVLAKGDLGSEYGVPLDGVTWVTTADEPVEFDPPPGVTLERMDRGRRLGDALVEGEVSAFLSPRPPQPYLDGAPEVGRLFDDPRAEEVSYYQRNGFYPIMHVVAFKNEVLEKYPFAVESVTDAFEKAKTACFEYYSDPNWSSLVWTRHLYEEERDTLGQDYWPYGLSRNRANLERFMGYSHDQGLMDRQVAVEELFVESTLNS